MESLDQFIEKSYQWKSIRGAIVNALQSQAIVIDCKHIRKKNARANARIAKINTNA